MNRVELRKSILLFAGSKNEPFNCKQVMIFLGQKDMSLRRTISELLRE